MKILVLGLVPVLLFWFIESKFGTLWGVAAACLWAVGECSYEFYRFKSVSKVTVFSSGLVIVLGAISFWLDDGVFFKFQPVVMEILFAGVLIFLGRGGDPFLFQMARKSRPELFTHDNADLLTNQKNLFARMTRHLVIFLVLHGVTLAYLALKGTTGQWAFWKGVGFNLLLGLWLVLEFLLIRRTKSRANR